MAISSGDISLLFKAKGDTDDAKKAFSDLKTSISGDVSTIESNVKSSVAGLTGKSGFGGLAESLSGISSIAGPVAIGIAAIGAAGLAAGAILIGLAESLFSLTKNASEYGSVIHDARDKTGLAAETISTLKVAADNSSSSLESVTSGAAKFAKTLGEARDGNDKAKESLKALGVTTYDLDTALSQASKTIFAAKDGTDQITLSQKAFGKAGADLIPVIKQFGGDLEAATKEAERLGETLTDKDVNASDNFGDALGTLSAQAKAAAVAFTSDLMPVLTSYFTMASEWYARNQSEVRFWGFVVAGTIQGMADDIANAFKFIERHADELRAYLANVTFGISELAIAAANLLRQQWAAKFAFDQMQAGAAVPSLIGTPSPTPKVGGGGGKAGKSPKDDKAAQEKKDLDASLQLQQLYLKRLDDAYKSTNDKLEKAFEKTGNEAAYSLGAKQAVEVFRQSSAGILAEMERIDTRRAQMDGKEKETENQKKLREEKTQNRRDEVNKKIADQTDAVNKKITDADKKLADDRVKIWEKLAKDIDDISDKLAEDDRKRNEEYVQEIIANDQVIIDDEKSTAAQRTAAQQDMVDQMVGLASYLYSLNENERKRKLDSLDDEKARRKKEIDDTFQDETEKQRELEALDVYFKKRALGIEADFQAEKARIAKETVVPVKGGPAAKAYDFGLGASFDAFIKQVKDKGPMLKEAFSQIADIGVNAFQSLGNAIGNLVQNWVLMGETGPAAMRKMVASVLAGVAAQSAVLAIFELAKGFAALFWNPVEAGAHFTAAALFGSLAAVTAIAGRVIAGDAFKQQANTATGQTASGSGQGSSSSNAGKVYSSQSDTVVEGGNTAGTIRPIPVNVTINVRSNDSHIVSVIKDNVRSNGQIRQLILNTG